MNGINEESYLHLHLEFAGQGWNSWFTLLLEYSIGYGNASNRTYICSHIFFSSRS